MSHYDEPIGFATTFMHQNSAFLTFLTFLVEMFLKNDTIHWKFNLFEPHHETWAYGSHICETLINIFEVMGQFCDKKVMLIPSFSIILASKVGI